MESSLNWLLTFRMRRVSQLLSKGVWAVPKFLICLNYSMTKITEPPLNRMQSGPLWNDIWDQLDRSLNPFHPEYSNHLDLFQCCLIDNTQISTAEIWLGNPKKLTKMLVLFWWWGLWLCKLMALKWPLAYQTLNPTLVVTQLCSAGFEKCLAEEMPFTRSLKIIK